MKAEEKRESPCAGKDLEDTISGRIRILRERNGLTKSKFASMCGYSAMMQTKYERAENTPSYDMLKVIARTFDCDFEWLKYGERSGKSTGQVSQAQGEKDAKATKKPVKEEAKELPEAEQGGGEGGALKAPSDEEHEREKLYVSCPAETGDRLREIRQERGLSQKAFAEKAGLSQRRYLDIENGKRRITVKSLKKLEETYGVGRDYLLYGHEESRNYPLTDEMIRFLQRSEKTREMVFREMQSQKADQ